MLEASCERKVRNEQRTRKERKPLYILIESGYREKGYLVLRKYFRYAKRGSQKREGKVRSESGGGKGQSTMRE